MRRELGSPSRMPLRMPRGGSLVRVLFHSRGENLERSFRWDPSEVVETTSLKTLAKPKSLSEALVGWKQLEREGQRESL